MRKMYSKKQIEKMIEDGSIKTIDDIIANKSTEGATSLEDLVAQVDENSTKTKLYKHYLHSEDERNYLIVITPLETLRNTGEVIRICDEFIVAFAYDDDVGEIYNIITINYTQSTNTLIVNNGTFTTINLGSNHSDLITSL